MDMEEMRVERDLENDTNTALEVRDECTCQLHGCDTDMDIASGRSVKTILRIFPDSTLEEVRNLPMPT